MPAFTPGFRLLLCSLFIVLCSHAAAARVEDEPIHINARSVEANEKTGAVVYSGNVVAEQGRLSIRADRIEVTTRKGKTELVRATGKPARLRQRAEGENEELRAQADRVDYRVSLGKIDLFGHVTLWRGEDLFRAKVLHYDLNSRNLNATGDEKSDERVHAVIQPKKPDAPASRP